MQYLPQEEYHGRYRKAGETKYKLAESVKECMKTAPVDKITVKILWRAAA